MVFRGPGRKLERAREEAGLDVDEVAALVGLKPATVERVEAGRHEPAPATAHRLAVAVGLRPSRLGAGWTCAVRGCHKPPEVRGGWCKVHGRRAEVFGDPKADPGSTRKMRDADG